MNKYTLLYIYTGVLLGMILTACENHAVYFHYEHIAANGWDRGDTVSFDIPKQMKQGRYTEEIGIRINSQYPYQSLSVIVEQTILPARTTICDTLNCQLMDESGNALGHGVNQFQYLLPLKTLDLQSGDSIHLDIHHYMTRETLPGIGDIGIRLSKDPH